MKPCEDQRNEDEDIIKLFEVCYGNFQYDFGSPIEI